MQSSIKLLCLTIATISIATLSGCASMQASQFSPGMASTVHVSNNLHQTITLGKFNYAKDSTSIMCRAGANIELPGGMTYSQYIHHAFQSQLISAHRYEAHATKALSINFTHINFDSFNGTWKIAGLVKINNNAPVLINSVSHFKTSLIGIAACHDVANDFGYATQKFITQTLSNKTVLKNLN